MRSILFAVLLLTGCAATPRGNAENVCNFVFMAALHAVQFNPLVMNAAVCSFGLELLDGEGARKSPGKPSKHAEPAQVATDDESDDEDCDPDTDCEDDEEEEDV